MITSQSLRNQQGGTLLGIILGLIIGLSIAVVIALVITKGATPFTNKFVARPDTAAGRLADPNKPLYGNQSAAKEAAAEFMKDPAAPQPAVTPGQPTIAATGEKTDVTKPVAQPATPATAVATTATTAAPTSTATTAKDPSATDDKWVYYLQAGAFHDQSDADNARAKIALLGIEARISDRMSESGNLYRVRIGPFNQPDAMNKTKSKLAENGVEATVVRTQK